MKRKPRKPADLRIHRDNRDVCYAWLWLQNENKVCIELEPETAKDCRRLAAWLIRAAEYLEAREDG